ncbi:dynein regulatory complex protein 9-like [Nasonia vitripennis]|uniref:Dynein regulatory complex protein 9 n=1 Tax=Nasonia vitripennis TaxID=7425 RepID=A0A7M7Q7C6_NASVI|nr:dynein regulatory complex protein 9-like [Nasonia vitripennis]
MTREQLTSELQRCRLREDNERLVSSKIEAFLRQSIEENERSALDWTERRQEESRAYEKDIRKLREEIEQNRAALEELQLEYKQRQEFIDGCLAEKEAARRQRELEEHVRGCAVKIQAWWRGVMVRRKLGPYRPEEKKRKQTEDTCVHGASRANLVNVAAKD